MANPIYKYKATAFSPSSYGGRGVCSNCHDRQAEYMTSTKGGRALCQPCASKRVSTGSYWIKIGDEWFTGIYKPEVRTTPDPAVAARFHYSDALTAVRALRRRGIAATIA